MQIDFLLAWARLQKMADDFVAMLPNMLVATVVFLIFALIAWLARGAVRRLSSLRGRRSNLSIVLARLTQWLILFLGLMIALVILFPNFSPGDLIQLLGISSVAIGFAFRDILQNFLSGLLILVTEPFRIGDQIVFNDMEGTVEDIETRATTLRTYDGRRVVIPNGQLYTDMIMVNTAYDRRRIEYDVGIGYEEDINRAKDLIMETLLDMPGILANPRPEVILVALSESTVNLRVRWWIEPPRIADLFETRDLVLQAIKEKLDANQVEMPYPIRHILFQPINENSTS